MTSSDAVVAVRRLLPKGVRVGHGGTLDPDAAGVLPIGLGAATRLFDSLADHPKEYVAELRLGVATDTRDASGVVTSRGAVSAGEREIHEAIRGFVGEIDQVPPIHSALRSGGKRYYEIARGGVAFEPAPRRVRIDSIDYLGGSGARHRVAVRCGKGAYIRSLCHDIGQALGCGGHMGTLIRSRSCGFGIGDGVTLESLRALAEAGRFESALIPPDRPLDHLQTLRIGEESRKRTLDGAPFDAPDVTGDGPFRVYCAGSFLGLGIRAGEGTVRMKLVLADRT